MAVVPVRIPLARAAGGLEAVSGLWNPAADSSSERSAILLAHGAGAGMEHPLLEALASELSSRGLAVLRFRYPYRERIQSEGRRRPPDPMAVLEAAHEDALAEIRRRAPGRKLILAGKSMGGRVGSHLAAKGAPCHGLILIGYPLHPAGQPDKERSEHFPAIAQPALFLQGTRDALCDLARLERSLRRFGGQASLAVVEGADHDFVRTGPGGRDASAAAADLAARIEAWERATFPL